jgi:hypothetical protein
MVCGDFVTKPLCLRLHTIFQLEVVSSKYTLQAPSTITRPEVTPGKPPILFLDSYGLLY